MKRVIVLAVIAVVAVPMAAAASARPTAQASVASASATQIKCTNAKIAFMGPLTGDAGFIGTEQLTWAKYGIKDLDKKMRMAIRLLVGDYQLSDSQATALAQKYLADQSVVGIVGPSTSGGVVATGPAFTAAKMASVGSSATRTTLTKGASPIRSFWRVVPDDSVQGPSDAAYMIKKGAKKVYIVDDQETYSTGLADVTQAVLKKAGVNVTRDSVSQSVTDFSSIVTKIPSDADFVFLPWQIAPNAQIFARQMAEQGKKAVVFGTDGTNAPGKFTAAGAIVSNFAPDISGIAADKALIAGWQKDNPGATLGSFGPPTYGAVQVLLLAIQKTCNQHNGYITRAQVFSNVNSVRIKDWILGGSFRFSTKTHDVLNGNFYRFQIQSNGDYKLITS